MTDDKSARAANIFDVARLAGVSHQTVSRVLNDLPNVRPATRERVEHAIAQLRYSPSPAARALVTRRTRTIGLVAPGVSDYGPTSIAMHFNFAARAARYNVETVSALDADPDGVRGVVEGLLRQRVDAIVLIVVDVGVLEVVRGLDLSIPVVAAAATARRSPLIVSIDQYRGARAAVRHLAELGHTRILHVAGAAARARRHRADPRVARRARRPPARDRRAVLRRLVGGERLPDRRRARHRAGHGRLRRATTTWRSGCCRRCASAACACRRTSASSASTTCPEAAYLYPPLTTVRQDFAALGELIMQKVLVAVEEPDTVTEDTPLPTHLIVRKSTQAPTQVTRYAV